MLIHLSRTTITSPFRLWDPKVQPDLNEYALSEVHATHAWQLSKASECAWPESNAVGPVSVISQRNSLHMSAQFG